MKLRNPRFEKWKPGVPKSALLLIAGMMWLGIGIMLDGLSYSWLRLEKQDYALMAAIIGFVCALVIHHFGMLRLVDRNLGRILPMAGRRCVFSFIPWKSYVLIMIMMLMGLVLRHSPIPKLYLSVVYMGMGTALILSSVRYLRYLVLVIRNN